MRLFIGLLLLASFSLSAKEINRIIALSPSSVEMLFEIGVGDRIVGTVEYADFPEAAKKIPRLGNYAGVQIETIVAAKPDLIVAWKSGNKQSDLKKLKSLGLNIIYVDPKTLSAVSENMIKLGKAIGVEQKANEAAEKFKQEYQAIKQRYASKNKVKVFYQLWHDPIRTVGDKSWVQSLIHDCNGDNVFKDSTAPYPVVSLESVIVKAPEIILMSKHSHADKAKKQLWVKWKNLPAVKNNLMESIDGSTLLRAGPRAVIGFSDLCSKIDKARQFN